MTTGICKRRARLAASLLLALALAGCSTTVQGTPKAASFDGSGTEDLPNLLTECDWVLDDQIAATVGGDAIARGFFGAICRWDVSGPNGIVKVTSNWFENGSLDVERETNKKMMYSVTDVTIKGRNGIRSQPPNDPDSCGVTAGGPDKGIVGWWVQYLPGSGHPDPCAAATELMELTLNLSR